MWERIKWLFITALKFNRTAYPRTKWGARLCLLSISSCLFSVSTLTVDFESGYVIESLYLTNQESSVYVMFLSMAILILGAILIFAEWNQKVRHTAKVLISSMPGASTEFPDEILDPTEKEFCRESVLLGVPQRVPENIEEQVRRYNAEIEVNIFRRYILHEKGQKLYIGGLARIPFLVAYGAMLRNLSADFVYYEKFHRGGNFALLSEENSHITLPDIPIVENVTKSGDIGLAIGISTPININQLPKGIHKATTLLSFEGDSERNKICNQDNLQELSIAILRIIDKLSRLPNCQRVNLFLSVQTTLAIEIGRRYQEGTHRNWVIHNFDAQSNSYNWSLELSKEGVALPRRCLQENLESI